MTALDSGRATAIDLSVLLGDWRNTNANGTIARIVCEPSGDGKMNVRCFTGERDWGVIKAPVFAFEFDSSQAGAVYALYDFGSEEVRLQANVKAGVLVVVTLNRFRDDSGRSNYFNREFFYRKPS
jgi:hypothetical protein